MLPIRQWDWNLLFVNLSLSLHYISLKSTIENEYNKDEY